MILSPPTWTPLSALVAVSSGASLTSLVLYGVDKAAAMSGRRRIPEARLHALALIGGWPGALLGQVLFNHKRRKPSFRLLFLLTVAVHGTATSALLLLPSCTSLRPW